MKQCSILIVDTGPLKTLAYAGQLNLLLKTGLPVHITDMVIAELEAGSRFSGNRLALEFIYSHLDIQDGLIEEVFTGVPEKIAKYEELELDPGEESIRKALKDYEALDCDEYALLLFEDSVFAKKAYILPDNVYLLTTRPFLQELERRNIIHSAEDVLKQAEIASLEADDERKLLNRKREHSISPRRDITIKPF